jgi:hypothetical protein
MISLTGSVQHPGVTNYSDYPLAIGGNFCGAHRAEALYRFKQLAAARKRGSEFVDFERFNVNPLCFTGQHWFLNGKTGEFSCKVAGVGHKADNDTQGARKTRNLVLPNYPPPMLHV